jgi:hypothetical protein
LNFVLIEQLDINFAGMSRFHLPQQNSASHDAPRSPIVTVQCFKGWSFQGEAVGPIGKIMISPTQMGDFMGFLASYQGLLKVMLKGKVAMLEFGSYLIRHHKKENWCLTV